jgi:succinate dehydrogenase / fumarate reductase membrane anchor subunit
MNLAAKKWVFIKISSVILLPLMFWFIINFINIYDNNYLDVVNFLLTQSLSFYLAYLLFLLIFFLH